MILTAGIDVGTSAVKVVVLESADGGGRAREGARARAMVVERIRRREQREVVRRAWEAALEASGAAPGDFHYVATTGEGEDVDFRTGHFYGMTAHARGAIFLDPAARAVVDVGALHGRAIKIDDRSRVLGYRMTSQCASGSGQFLENIARYLGVTLDEIGPLSSGAAAPEKISGICAVLAETDVINMVSRGITVANILKGIHESMAGRLVKLLRSVGAEGVVLVTGGLSADTGLLQAMTEGIAGGKASRGPGRKARDVEQGPEAQTSSGMEIRTHPDAVYAGALGAALWGAYRFERLRERKAA